MVTTILQTVPICPECQALMIKRHLADVYFCCADCKAILKVIEPGKTDNELIVTDGRDNET